VDAPLPDVSLGWSVGHWIETLLCHGPGDVEGDPVSLDRDFLEAIVRAYALDPPSGRRLIRRYILSRSKGRAKSELAGFLTIAEALGPVRFDHWAVRGETSPWGFEYDPGDPVGRPVKRPFIRCLATEEQQTGNTYDTVHYILTSDKAPLSEGMRFDAGLTRTFLPGGGEIRPSSASSASKDGGKETFYVADESHLYVLPELKQMLRTVRRNATKRAEGWGIETTTMFEEGAGSSAEETFEAHAKGKLRSDVILDHHEGPDPSTFDWESDDALRAALAIAYWPAAWVDLDAKIAEIRDPASPFHESVRYFINRRNSAASDFLDLGDWDRLIDHEARLEPGSAICVGFDGSRDTDSTGIVGVNLAGHREVLGLWEPAETGGSLPRAAIRARVDEIFSTFEVVRWYGDSRYWETDHDEWEAAYGSPPVMTLPQSIVRLHEAASRTVTLVRAALTATDPSKATGSPSEAGFSHSGDPDLRRHIGNARRERYDGRGGAGEAARWKLAKKGPGRRIDLAVAMTFADQARGDAIAAGEFTAGDFHVWSV